ncbi:MAG: hypothetical protein AAFO07_30415 [Bacteroidota bacterium]
MKKNQYSLLLVVMIFSFFYCSEDALEEPAVPVPPIPEPVLPAGTSFLEGEAQTTSGDPVAGYNYLLYGNMIGGGIPYDIFIQSQRGESANELNRTGLSANLPAGFNVYELENGTSMAAGLTCFGCHASYLNGDFVPGLGNSFINLTFDQSFLFSIIDFAVSSQYGKDSPEWEEYSRFSRGALATGPYAIAPFMGVNPAFMLEQAGVANRNPEDLTWRDSSLSFPIPDQIVCSDTPPLWHVQKKNALYYNGMGRGDLTKHLMQVTVIAIEDSTSAREVHNNFDDVYAWLQTIEPPQYPEAINQELATIGESVFAEHCQKCHGTYGAEETYPNLLVELNQVQTDPVYANYFVKNSDFTDWYNRSWFANTGEKSEAKPSLGYVAPPLDGIWATAPYLHNGSIPTLEALLNSSNRPPIWRRRADPSAYDFVNVGWQFTIESSASDNNTYDTNIEAYGNQGHYYGDVLSKSDRLALIEYLKTL